VISTSGARAMTGTRGKPYSSCCTRGKVDSLHREALATKDTCKSEALNETVNIINFVKD
jgi:hypothetical protein